MDSNDLESGYRRIYLKTSDRKAEPDWSKLPPFKELLRIAFRDFKIESSDHPYIRRLRDEG
jgi:hypothetical protein